MSQSNRDAYLLESGNHPDAVERAFEWLVEEWEDPNNRNTIIAIPTKTNLDNVEDRLKPRIGEEGFNGIRGPDNFADIGKGVTLHTMTRRIRPRRTDSGPVLALFTDDEQLEDIDELNGVSSILVVPWNRDDVEKWEQRKSPEIVDFTPNS